jgi:hypothetical protein
MSTDIQHMFEDSYWRKRYESNTKIKQFNKDYTFKKLIIPTEFLSDTKGQAAIVWAINDIEKRGIEFTKYLKLKYNDKGIVIECHITPDNDSMEEFLANIPFLPQIVPTTTEKKKTDDIVTVKKKCKECLRGNAPEKCTVSLIF